MEGMPMPGGALPVAGDEIAGKYRIESVLGQGGMGAVFAARNVLTGKRVAIKWLLPEHAASTSRERLLREAQIAASIDHPNVVDIYDVGEHLGGLFLVMEYLRGRPLSDVLAERGRLDPEELITLLVPAMRGVHAAHMAGVVHRDLKPENIILSESDGHIVPKVVDFGVSKQVGTSGIPQSSLTRTGALVGTPHYMALEQVDGTNQIDGRTDVYAFGVLLYRALTGHFPFDGSSLGEVILKIGTKDAVPMRMLRADLPPELDSVVLRALSRDRGRRFSDLEELSRSLLPFAPGVRLRSTADTTGRFVLSQTSLEPRSQSGNGPRVSGTPHFGLDGALAGGGLGGASPRSSQSMLGAAVSMHGSPARPTPVGPAARPKGRAAWALVGLCVVGLIGAGYWIWSRDGNPRVADLPAPKAQKLAPADQEPAALVPQLVAERAMASTKVDSIADAPDVPGPDLPDAMQKTSDERPTAAIMASAQAAVPAAAERPKRPRVLPAAKGRPVKLIPGDRTKGLSVDEF